jgi:outer membrane protein
MTSKIFKTLSSILVLALSQSVYSTDLLEVYYEALESDPAFKSAYSVFMAESQAIPTAAAGLLPQLTASGLVGRVYTEVMAGNSLDVNRTYSQNQLSAQASQTIFNLKLWSLLEQARSNVRAALANFNDSTQNLMLRTSKAYFDVLLAQDNLTSANALRKANKRQLEQAQERFNVGLDPITTVYQAKAAYDQSCATVIAAQNNITTAQQNLTKLTNQSYTTIAPLKNKRIPLIYPQPMQAETWVTTSLKQNYKLTAAKYYLEASRQNIKTQFSGHLPSFNIYGSVTEIHNLVTPYGVTQSPITNVNQFFNNIFVPQMQRNANTGVNMTLPIFQGGLVVAKTKEAEYQFQNYSNQLESVKRDVIANTQITFHTIASDIEKVKADKQSLESQRVSLTSIQEQYQVGTKTITDVLYAQQQYFQTQLQYTSDQYSLIIQILQLKYLAGSLNVKDLEEINSWLQTQRISGLSPQSKRILDIIMHHSVQAPQHLLQQD